MKTAFFLVIALALPPIAYAQTTWYVPDDFPAGIQVAINGASNGDTIIVRPGTYVENIDFIGKAITVKSEQGAMVTTIDGNQAGSVVTFQSGEGTDSVLEGFTVINGTGTLYTTKLSGGGVLCIYGSSPVVANNIIRNNTSDWGGGVCCNGGSAPSIINNIIYQNTVGHGGGGIRTHSSFSEIRGNVIYDNNADAGGGIQVQYHSTSLIYNNIIFQNQANVGGGIICRGSYLESSNNTVIENNANDGGGGFYCWHNCYITISNTIVWDNNALSGPELWIGETDDPVILTIDYSNVEGGQSSVYIEPGCTLNWGAGMIDADPLFVDPASGDFHLTFQSPCGNSGNPDTSGLPSEDFEGNPRIAFNQVDIGADEFYNRLYHDGDVVPGTTVGLCVIGWPDKFVTVGLGSALLDPPWPTRYGNLYLAEPIKKYYVGRIPTSGVLNWTVTVPSQWSTGERHPVQALIGGLGWNSTRLSNPLILVVE